MLLHQEFLFDDVAWVYHCGGDRGGTRHMLTGPTARLGVVNFTAHRARHRAGSVLLQLLLLNGHIMRKLLTRSWFLQLLELFPQQTLNVQLVLD